MRLILLGPPGSGKGTLAVDLARLYHIRHISTGDIFRQMIREKTELGQKASVYIDAGQLVPDDLTIAMVQERLASEDCRDGFMLDGFPRTLPQAEALDRLTSDMNCRIDAVLNVQVPDDLILRRLSGRRMCRGCGRGYNIYSMPPKQENICDVCGDQLIQRSDDQPETIRQRLNAYREQTEPLIDYYAQRDLLLDVDNSGKIGENLPDVDRALKSKLGDESLNG
ncbi:MAG: adenylate kinase [Eubacteriales bacterium]|nr:adenylate kinase [Eubacteriales bacterium]